LDLSNATGLFRVASLALSGIASQFTMCLYRRSVDGALGAGVDGSSRRILVVDDNKDAADTLAMLLRLQGHEVHVAYAGAHVCQLAVTLRPQVVLLDIAMPEVSGLEAARALRSSTALQSVRLIAVSGMSSPDTREVARQVGFEVYLTKPVDSMRLNALLS